MIAITTSNSIKVKTLTRKLDFFRILNMFASLWIMTLPDCRINVFENNILI